MKSTKRTFHLYGVRQTLKFSLLSVMSQMQVLESRHKSELSTHYKSQERELEQLKTSYERDIERLRSRQRAEMDQRYKYETNEERKFEKSLRDKRDSEMKRFLGQQKADYRATKNLFKTVSLYVFVISKQSVPP